MADEVREVPGAVRIRYVGVKPYGWWWKRTYQATWVVEIFEQWTGPDSFDYCTHSGWIKRWEGVSLEAANAEADRWRAHPETFYEPV